MSKKCKPEKKKQKKPAIHFGDTKKKKIQLLFKFYYKILPKTWLEITDIAQTVIETSQPEILKHRTPQHLPLLCCVLFKPSDAAGSPGESHLASWSQ